MNAKSFRYFFLALLIIILSPLIININKITAGQVRAAATINDTITELGKSAPKSLPQKNIPSAIGQIIQRVLEIVGAIFFAMMIYGGFHHIFSRGDSGKIKQARDILFWAVIGLVLILTSYAIVSWLMETLKP